MAELKSSLKQAKKLLGENHSEDALNVLQEFLDDGVEDYMLFCFAALAYGNLDEKTKAKTLYEKAIKLDEKLPAAWQGLFKLYDTGKLASDERAIDVANHLIATCDSEEKRLAIEESRRRFFFELCRYEDLQNDLGKNIALLGKIIERFVKKDTLTSTEALLLEKVFNEVKASFETNAEWNLHYCRFLHKKRCQECYQAVIEFCSHHPFVDIVWIRDRLIEILSSEYFCQLKVCEQTFGFYEKCTLPLNDVETKFDRLIRLLRDVDMSSALDIIDGLTDASLTFLPLAMVAVHLLAEVENWEKVSKVIDWVRSQGLSERCNDVARSLKRRVLLEMDNFEEAARIQIPLASLPKTFVIDSAKVVLWKKENLDDLIEQVGPDSCDAKRFRIYRALYNGNAAEAIKDGEALLGDKSASWRDVVLVAELNIALSKDATPLLVKAAKLNPRSSRVFFLLAKVLRAKNPGKARSCLERAVKIRPTNEEYVRMLDDMYEEIGESIDQRLNLLNTMGTYKKPMWLRRKLAKLAKSKQDWDTAIGELQQIVRHRPDELLSWASLAEAYSYRGNLQSSVNAYGRVLEIDPSSDYAICLIQVLMRMHNLEGAAEQCTKWRETENHNPQLKNAVDILEAQVHLRLFNSTLGDERVDHLKKVFNLLDGVIARRPRISLAYKLAADALLHAIKFRNELLVKIGIPSSWSVSDRLSAVRSAVMFYSVALDLNRENAWAWNDLAIALLSLARFDKSEQHATKAHECLRKAMSLSKCAQMHSQLWTLIAEAERLSTLAKTGSTKDVMSIALQQHYLVRALQLNKANDEAWLRLALLYYTNGAMVEAHLTIETALKHNPQLAEAWCAWALKAESEGLDHEAMDMYRHSISIKPVPAAVMKYTSFLCQSLRVKSFDPATVMIDFSKVLRLRDELESSDKPLLLHIGVLAELFGHYEDAVQCIADSGRSGPHLQRARIRAGHDVKDPVKSLSTLASLCSKSSEELFTLLKEHRPLYKNLFERLVAPEAQGLQELYSSSAKSISVPLVVAAIIRFDLPLCDQAVTVLHDVLPRHELIDVFPTVMPDGMDNGLKYVEQDGEEPFRYSHFIAKPLWEILKKRRDELENQVNGESPISA
uniref:TPR_REGION domain-containing protein n=1 Tax=Haemonchus contortus TaxID=6289 RepID=A0A7I4Y183_HAECO